MITLTTTDFFVQLASWGGKVDNLFVEFSIMSFLRIAWIFPWYKVTKLCTGWSYSCIGRPRMAWLDQSKFHLIQNPKGSMTLAQFDIWLDFVQESSGSHGDQVVHGFNYANFILRLFCNALTHSLDMLALLTYVFIIIKTLEV